MLLDYQGTPPVAKLVDLVRIACNSTGSGAITLGSAVPGYRGAEVLENGAVYSYSIQQGANYEIGRATFLATPSRLIRSPTASSNGGAPLNLLPNASVALVALAADLYALSGNIADVTAQVSALAATVNALQSGLTPQGIAVPTSEDIPANVPVNIYINNTTVLSRRADASDPNKTANGFTNAAFTNGQAANVFVSGVVGGVALGSASGEVFLAEGGGFTIASPTAAGHISQSLGTYVPTFGIIWAQKQAILL
jgi:hypothetical protein